MSDSSSRPICEACYSRVEGALTYLSSEEAVTEWVEELTTWFSCEDDFPSTEACHDYVRVAMSSVLGELQAWKQGSLGREWCQHWGSCTAQQHQQL